MYFEEKNLLMRFISSKYFSFLFVFVLGLLSFYFRYLAFSQTDYVNGWDGYFYLIQLRSWMETGTMHSPDASMIYPLMAAINLLVEDYLLTYKLTAAILTSIFGTLVFFLSKNWSGSVYLAILLASFSLFSPQLTYFAAQYPKNLLGMVFLLSFFLSLGSKWKILSLVFLVFNYFGHRLSFGMALLFALVYLLRQKLTFRQLLVVGLSIAVIVLLGFSLPGLLHWSDLGRLEGILSSELHFSPYSFIQEFGKNRLSWFWFLEIGLASVSFFTAVLFVLKKEKNINYFAIISLCAILLFPFLKWSLTSFSYRFFLVFVLISPLLFNFYFPKGKTWNKVYLILAIFFLGTSFYSYTSYNPSLHDPNYAKYEKITQGAIAALKSHKPELIIAHNSLAEYFTFTTKIDAMPWLPEYEIAPTALWRIAAGVRAPLIEYYLSEKEKTNTFRLALRYYLIREDTWQKMLATIKEEDLALYQELFNWRNPHRIRPNFLLRKKNQ